MPHVHELDLPDGYRQRLPRSWQPWLEQLPELVASYLERWELTVVGQFPLSYSYVVPVERADGRACVLKIQPTGVPEVEGAGRELLGLRLAGPVAIEVVEQDAVHGVLLLDRGSRGPPLTRWPNATTMLPPRLSRPSSADYGRLLEDPAPLGLQAFEEFAGAFERFDRGPLGEGARAKAASATDQTRSVGGMDDLGSAVRAIRSARDVAERVLAELLAVQIEPYLLHGDLHHGNVLVDEERGLVVTDPWGLYGDRSADVAPALHDPIEFVARTRDVNSLIRRRLSIYAEVLDIDREHLVAWCSVYNVSRALWTLEEVEQVDEIPEKDAGLRTVAALRTLI